MQKLSSVFLIAIVCMLSACDTENVAPNSVKVGNAVLSPNSTWVWETIEYFNDFPRLHNPEYDKAENPSTGRFCNMMPYLHGYTYIITVNRDNSINFTTCIRQPVNNQKTSYEPDTRLWALGSQKHEVIQTTTNSITFKFESGNYRAIITLKKR